MDKTPRPQTWIYGVIAAGFLAGNLASWIFRLCMFDAERLARIEASAALGVLPLGVSGMFLGTSCGLGIKMLLGNSDTPRMWWLAIFASGFASSCLGLSTVLGEILS